LILNSIGFEEPPTQAQIKNMPYLSNIVKEVMRLYHPLGFNVRAAKQDTTLPVGGGPDGKLPVGVPKGTLIRTYVHAFCFSSSLLVPGL